MIDEMEQMGIVGPHAGSKPRQVLITYQQWLEMSMRQADANQKNRQRQNPLALTAGRVRLQPTG